MANAASPPTDLNKPRHPARLVAVYEDYDSGKRAESVCQKILEIAHLDKECGLGLWKYEMLGQRTLRETAAEEAAEAILLVLAPHNNSVLPSAVCDWLQQSLPPTDCPKALLVLWGPEADGGWASELTVQIEMLSTQWNVRCWRLRLQPSNGTWSEPAYDDDDLRCVAQEVFSLRREAAFALQANGTLKPLAP